MSDYQPDALTILDKITNINIACTIGQKSLLHRVFLITILLFTSRPLHLDLTQVQPLTSISVMSNPEFRRGKTFSNGWVIVSIGPYHQPHLIMEFEFFVAHYGTVRDQHLCSCKAKFFSYFVGVIYHPPGGLLRHYHIDVNGCTCVKSK